VNEPSRRWLKLTVAYDGTRYAGYQYQPNLPTIQGALEQAWCDITGENPRLTASGRTDAGVHALGQVVGVDTASVLAPERLVRGLNARLPDDIVIVNVTEAPAGFHATHDALRKLYRYQIYCHPVRPVFERRTTWHFPQPLDATAMQSAAEILVGRHDFASFETAGSERSTTVRTLSRVDVVVHADSPWRIDVEVEGDGFLYNMVRGIVGTLVEVGRGARPVEWMNDVLAACDRRAAGPNAPPQGLVLVRVDYGFE
jgi:tRNA pseudouridine38-40 synthase